MEHDKVIKTLNILEDRIKDVSEDEKTALEEAIKTLELYERKQEEEIDFQGWPLRHHTMKDLREFMKRNKSLDNETKILVLEDDGMAYGARNGYCTEISVSENKEGGKEIHIWY
jgi:hypothetical protein